jgi:hypothetical protein
MAKKPDFNQAAEIRSILQELGKQAKFKDVFEKLQANHKGYQFNKNSYQQAFTSARAKLGFKERQRPRKKTAAQPAAAAAVRVVPASGPRVRHADGLVVGAITTAQKLIAACGGKEAAKHVIDNVTV